MKFANQKLISNSIVTIRFKIRIWKISVNSSSLSISNNLRVYSKYINLIFKLPHVPYVFNINMLSMLFSMNKITTCASASHTSSNLIPYKLLSDDLGSWKSGCKCSLFSNHRSYETTFKDMRYKSSMLVFYFFNSYSLNT